MQKVILCLMISASISSPLQSQYADLGTGTLKNQIWWFDWNGFNIVNGASRTFTTGDGLNVTVSFSNVQGPVFTPSIMNTWSGAVLHFLYDFNNATTKPALLSPYTTQNSQYTVNITATRNGLPAAFKFIAADAEGSALSETTSLTTNGSNWLCVDFFRNSSQTSNPFSGCNTQIAAITETYGGSSGIGQSPVIATNAPGSGSLTVNCSFNRNGVEGQMAIAFGIFGSVDRSDLPPGYGFAEHSLAYTTSNPCNYLPPLPATSLIQNLKIGDVAGDSDPLQTLDDNASGADEDGISTFPLYNGSGLYNLIVPVTNTTGNAAYLSGWFDRNRSGTFDNNEFVTVTIPNNATTASLSWTGLPSALPAGSTSNWGFRFRLTFSLSASQSASGYAPDGEVEDYLANILQATSADFNIPDTVCVNTPVTITNTSPNATSSYWNFCVANINSTPGGTNLGNIGNQFQLPVFIDYVQYNGNWYGFMTNNTPGKLTRLDFGNSLLNTPTAVNLGNVGGTINDAAEGIQLAFSEGRWYAIIVGGNSNTGGSRIMKIDFGPNLTNTTPTGTNWGNVGGMNYPGDLHLFNDKGNWYAFTVDANSTVIRFSFGSSFQNPPTAVNFGNVGGTLNYTNGIYIINDNGQWYGFVISRNSSSITRLNFGNSLLNTPTATALGNPNNTLNLPRDIYVMKFCNELVGFVVNEGSDDIVKLNFASLTSIPTAVSLGNIGNLAFPHSISKLFRVGPDLYTFIPNVNNNSLTRINFSGCTNSSIPNYSGTNPPPFSYSIPGTYNINLTIDDGLATQSSICKQIVVVAPPVITLGNDTGFCANTSIMLGSTLPQNAGYVWSTAQTTQTITVQQPGSYHVAITDRNGCPARDTINVITYPPPVINIIPGNDTAICSNASFAVTATGGNSYTWSTNQTGPSININAVGTYVVTGIGSNGCTGTDTIRVTGDALPISVSNDTLVCQDQQIQLNASGGATYTWFPPIGLNNPNISNPLVTAANNMTYFVTVTDGNYCSNIDSVKLSVRPQTAFQINPSANICVNKSTQLTASGGDIYSWLPSASLNNAAVANPIASPTTTTTYEVNITDTVCQNTILLTTTVTVLSLPQVKATKSNDLDCSNDRSQLNATGGQNFIWSPVSSLNNSTISNPVATPAGTTMYVVKGTDASGCSNYDSVLVSHSSINASGYFMPNSFTPNNDGLNDCYGIRFWGVIQQLDFSIYNRWGERIFYTKNPNDCWDGTYKGKQQSTDVYVYMIKAKTICGNTFKKGVFTLVR